MSTETIYYQFQKSLGYQVFLRFESCVLESQLKDMIEGLGFGYVNKDELKAIEFDKSETKVLTIKEASLKVAKQLNSGFSNSSYGDESLSNLGNYQVYKYKNVGMMIFGGGNYFWELGVKHASANIEAVQVILTRFLAWSLAYNGILSFWGVPVDEGFVVMKPNEANLEALFIDIDKGMMLSRDGAKPISAGMQVLRLDETLKGRTLRMSREELVSYLSTNTCYFSYFGLDPKLARAVYEFSSLVDGVVYPVENFKPRTGADAA